MKNNSATNNLKNIDYKNTDMLKKFLDTHSRLLSRKKTGVSAHNQRKITRAVKRARIMGLLPFISK